MREILFRGKTAKGKWVYGCLLNDKHDRIGFYNNGYKFEINAVIPETVGQFTGLWDYANNCKRAWSWNRRFDKRKLKNCEVIGNIHDNPELLKEQ